MYTHVDIIYIYMYSTYNEQLDIWHTWYLRVSENRVYPQKVQFYYIAKMMTSHVLRSMVICSDVIVIQCIMWYLNLVLHDVMLLTQDVCFMCGFCSVKMVFSFVFCWFAYNTCDIANDNPESPAVLGEKVPASSVAPPNSLPLHCYMVIWGHTRESTDTWNL